MQLTRKLTTAGATVAAAGTLLLAGVPSAHAATGVPYLSQGSYGLGVACAQWTENIVVGPPTPLAVDGDFGPATYKATVEFQNAYHLYPDGIIGPNTGSKITSFIGNYIYHYGDQQIWNGHWLGECYNAVPTNY